MLESIGMAFDGLPELELVKDLEAFEYPILSELRPAGGRRGVYLEKWCTRNSTIDRSLIVKTDQRYIAEYLGRRISMLDLLLNSGDGSGYLVDKEQGVIQRVFLVPLQELPQKYLPKPTAFHDESLRPEWDKVPHSFLLGPDWDAYALSNLERRYNNVASFSFFTEPGRNRTLPSQILRYIYRGGYSMVSAYRTIRDYVPVEDRTRSAGVSASSPGVLTMEAPSAIATHLEQNLTNAYRTEKHYELVHSWSRLNPDNVNQLPETAYRDLKAFCEALSVDIKALMPEGMTPIAILNAGKLVASFYRQLHDLLAPPGDVEFIGGNITPPEHAEDGEG